MSIEKITMPYPCDLLVDQKRFVGKDPVGYRCTNAAKWELEGLRFCDKCRTMLFEEPMRLDIRESLRMIASRPKPCTHKDRYREGDDIWCPDCRMNLK